MTSPTSAGPSGLSSQRTAAAQSMSGPGAGLPEDREPETVAEAAQQFEKVLVRQFVEVMTKDMFSTSLAGEGGPGWMKSQRGTQRDMMTDMLTDHLTKAGALDLSEKLSKKWGAAGAPSAPSAPSPQNASPPAPAVDPLPSPPTAPTPHEHASFDRAA